MNQIKHRSGKTELERRVCRKCSIYYPTLKALNAHLAVCTAEVSTLEGEEDIELDQGDIYVYTQEADDSINPKPLNIFDQLERLYDEKS